MFWLNFLLQISLQFISASEVYLNSAMNAKILLENQNTYYIIPLNMKHIEKYCSLKLYILMQGFKKYCYGQLKISFDVSFNLGHTEIKETNSQELQLCGREELRWWCLGAVPREEN